MFLRFPPSLRRFPRYLFPLLRTEFFSPGFPALLTSKAAKLYGGRVLLWLVGFWHLGLVFRSGLIDNHVRQHIRVFWSFWSHALKIA